MQNASFLSQNGTNLGNLPSRSVWLTLEQTPCLTVQRCKEVWNANRNFEKWSVWMILLWLRQVLGWQIYSVWRGFDMNQDERPLFVWCNWMEFKFGFFLSECFVRSNILAFKVFCQVCRNCEILSVIVQNKHFLEFSFLITLFELGTSWSKFNWQWWTKKIKFCRS